MYIQFLVPKKGEMEEVFMYYEKNGSIHLTHLKLIELLGIEAFDIK